jgi:hypothetical protein
MPDPVPDAVPLLTTIFVFAEILVVDALVVSCVLCT